MSKNSEILKQIFNGTTNSFKYDTDGIKHYHIQQMLNKLHTIFIYKNLPEHIPQFNLEDILLNNGHCIVTHVDGNLYAIAGNGGGKPNAYYYPEDYIVANPYLNLSKTYKIDTDCVLCKNTSYFYPLRPLVEYYAHQLTVNDISLDVANINSRIMTILTAPTSDIKNACEKYMEDIKDGKISTILDNRSDFLEGIKTHPYASTGHTNVMTQLLEVEQYIKGSFLNEIGLNANYNMKRESINNNEAGLNEDGLTPLITDMYNQRKLFVEKINEIYGTDIEVYLAPVFRKNIELAESVDNNPNEDLHESEVNEGSQELEVTEESEVIDDERPKDDE